MVRASICQQDRHSPFFTPNGHQSPATAHPNIIRILDANACQFCDPDGNQPVVNNAVRVLGAATSPTAAADGAALEHPA
jgi:hypothetical protein